MRVVSSGILIAVEVVVFDCLVILFSNTLVELTAVKPLDVRNLVSPVHRRIRLTTVSRVFKICRRKKLDLVFIDDRV